MVRSITSQPTSFSRLNACEGEISWSMRTTSADCSSRSRRSSSRLPSPKYAALSNPARFCVKVAATSNPSVFASWRSSASEASNSRSLTRGNCTAATMARFDFLVTSCVMIPGGYQHAAWLPAFVLEAIAVLGDLRNPAFATDTSGLSAQRVD